MPYKHEHAQFLHENLRGQKCRISLVIIILNDFFRTAGREKDVRDNNATAYVFVRRDVAMAITGYIVHFLQ
jgi:hypothetical protein